MSNIIPFPDPELIVFACADCNCHNFIIVLEDDRILCSECNKEHPDGIKWVYKEDE